MRLNAELANVLEPDLYQFTGSNGPSLFTFNTDAEPIAIIQPCACPACSGRAADEQPSTSSFGPQYGLNAAERGDTGPNSKPSFTIDEAAAQITRSNSSWNGTNVLGQPATVTYAFRASEPATMPNGTADFVRFNATQIEQATLSLQSWSDVANITFRRVGSGTTGEGAYSNNAQMLFGNFATGDSYAFAWGPFGSNGVDSVSGDSWFDAKSSTLQNPANLNYGRQTITHEIGHAIGLSHPGSYNAGTGSPTYANAAVYYEDSRQYSVMSYWSETNTGASNAGYSAAGPLLDDIAAAQRLYGANMTTRTGDTTYGFNSNTGRDHLSTNSANTPVIFAAWDAGGTDTFDFSGYTQAQLIDLGAGNFSNVGGLVGNVAIAQGATIENAVGGTGADVIRGNAANNRLTGGGGVDQLFGLAGDDTLIAGAGAVRALVKPQGQANATQATAASLNGVFTLTADPNIANATTIPHATARATASGQSEWYSFTVAQAGQITIDIDGASFDTEIYLVNSAGTQLASNDDSRPIDPGSVVNPNDAAETRDSAITYNVTQPGTYFVRVERYDSNATTAGGTYSLHVSVPGATVTASGYEGSRLDGGDGADTLIGGTADDILIGGAGNDRLDGNGGRDTATGGAGADTFVYDAVGDSAADAATRDRITDFTRGEDRIDLSGVGSSRFVGTAAFSGVAGEVRSTSSGGVTLVELDRNGDRVADVQIELTGTLALASSDFVGLGTVTPPTPPSPPPSTTLTGTSGNDQITGTAGITRIEGLDGNDTLTAAVGTALTKAAVIANNSRAAAVSLDGAMALTANANIANATTIPHATVQATASGQAEWYSFTVAQAGRIALDIDAASFDTEIYLHNAAGMQLASNDDTTPIDPGSAADTRITTRTLDSGLSYDVAAPGTYYVRVERFNSDVTTANGTYTLHISVPGATLAGAGLQGTVLDGGNGADTLRGNTGNDTLLGGAGNDELFGAGGRDLLTGGAGADTYLFTAIGDSAAGVGLRDVITDFSVSEDRIDLDAAGGRRFIGGGAFSGTAGDVRATVQNGVTLVEVDSNGDRRADLQVELTGSHTLTTTNFSDLSTAPLVKAQSQVAATQSAAISLNGYMSVAANANIANATVDPHATVQATASGQAEWYKFTVAQSGKVTLDIDGASFDTEIYLHNAAGIQLASNDDTTPIDAGSRADTRITTRTLDSSISFDVATPGEYFVRVERFNSDSTPAGGTYTLHVSVPGEAASAGAATTASAIAEQAFAADADYILFDDTSQGMFGRADGEFDFAGLNERDTHTLDNVNWAQMFAIELGAAPDVPVPHATMQAFRSDPLNDFGDADQLGMLMYRPEMLSSDMLL